MLCGYGFVGVALWVWLKWVALAIKASNNLPVATLTMLQRLKHCLCF